MRFTILAVVILLLTGCSLPGSAGSTPTIDANGIMTAAAATAFFRLSEIAAQTPTASATLPDTPTPLPTKVLLPTSIPTIVPIPGVMRANANVRGIPQKSKAHDLGGLLFGQPVHVIGRNDAATWLYIIYSDAPGGTGWVTTNAITLNGEMGLLPILIYPNGIEAAPIMIPPFVFKLNGTPQPPSTPPADWSKWGTLTQSANVRIGPSVGFLSIGVINPGLKVTFRGRIADNTWVQIDYPSGPDGHGWILSSLVQANDGYGGLPIYDVLGTPVTPKPVVPTSAPGAKETTQAQTTPEAPTSTPQPPQSGGIEGEVSNQINVRSGPAQSYNPYGLLNPKDKVVVTGVTLNRFWYQIKYASSPTGYGWVASQYVKISGNPASIPYFNNEGTPIPK